MHWKLSSPLSVKGSLKQAVALLLCMLWMLTGAAQVVKNERLLSFEDGAVPAFLTTGE